MIHTLLLSVVVALQAPVATRPAAPIALVPAGSPQASVEVPADLARLAGPDTVAVLYVPDVAGLQQALEKLAGVSGAPRGMLPSASELRQLLRRAVRTDLEVPLNQPALWWMEMRPSDGDEPPMGFDAMVMHQAFRIPGATQATEKARAAAAADPKSKPAMPVRARDRRAAVSVLPGDLVVFSSDGEPVARPADGGASSALLERLPQGQICGRVDLGRIMAENGDQLRMLGGMAAMGLGGGGVPPDADAAARRRADVRQAFAEGVGRQLGGVVEALMQLKRASFALDLRGDELSIWTDWTRDVAFPTGLDERQVKELAARLPSGLDAYAGASTSALEASYGDRFVIDDVLATVGGTPEQRQAWEGGVSHMRAAIAQVDGGVVGGLAAGPSDGAVVAFRVKDAAAFRRELTASAAAISASGLAAVKVNSGPDRLDWEAVPDTARLQEIAELTGTSEEEAKAMVERAASPFRVGMTISGSDVLMTYARGEASTAPASGAGADLRDRLVQGDWGTMDWFATVDLRGLIRRMANSWMEQDPKAESREAAMAAVAEMTKGAPTILRARQSVQGATARLSLSVNLAELKSLAAQLEALAKSASAGRRPEGDEDDDDDDDHGAGEREGRRGADDGA